MHKIRTLIDNQNFVKSLQIGASGTTKCLVSAIEASILDAAILLWNTLRPSTVLCI